VTGKELKAINRSGAVHRGNGCRTCTAMKAGKESPRDNRAGTYEVNRNTRNRSSCGRPRNGITTGYKHRKGTSAHPIPFRSTENLADAMNTKNRNNDPEISGGGNVLVYHLSITV
jgi:hypothetical protein